MINSNISYSNLFVQSLYPQNGDDVVNKKYLDERLSSYSNNSNMKLVDKVLSQRQILYILDFTQIGVSPDMLENGALPVKNDDSKYPNSEGGWMYINDNINYPGIVNNNLWKNINWKIIDNIHNESIYTFGGMKCIFVRLIFNSVSDINNIPFITLKANNKSVSFYLKTLDQIQVGKDTVLYIGQNPLNIGFTNLSESNLIQLTYDIGNDNNIGNDNIIESALLSTDTSSNIGTTNFTLFEFGSRFYCYLQRAITIF